MRLKNKSILVTGGSRGIGAGIAKFLATEGARVAVTYASNKSLADTLVSQLPGEGHLSIPLNVAIESEIENAFKISLAAFGQIDGLVNNAGITKDNLLLRMKTEDFDQVIQTNLRGTFLCTKFATKLMLKARKGSIVNITSVVGHTGSPGQGNYSASKSGITSLTKSIAQEVGSRQIRVNCVAPGFITTDMTDILADDQKNAILSKIPLQKFGGTEDIAAAVAFLLSDEASYITGQTLHVNGGMYM